MANLPAPPAPPRPLVHYGPAPCSCGRNATCQATPGGNAAYDAMFTPAGAAGWAGVRSRIAAFTFHINSWISLRGDLRGKRCRYLPDGTLRSAAKLLRDDGVGVSVEVGGLRPYPNCTSPALWAEAGIIQFRDELPKLARWSRLGGRVEHIWLDSPVSKMMAGGVHGNCGMGLGTVAAQLAVYIHRVRAKFPGVQVALIEPLPWYSVRAGRSTYPPIFPKHGYGDYQRVMSTVVAELTAHGERLDAIIADAPYDFNERSLPPSQAPRETRPGWHKLRAASEFVRGDLRLGFGHIFNSDTGGEQSIAAFDRRTLLELQRVQEAGVALDIASVRSWYPYPDRFVPETAAGTFAHLMQEFVDRLEGPIPNFRV